MKLLIVIIIFIILPVSAMAASEEIPAKGVYKAGGFEVKYNVYALSCDNGEITWKGISDPHIKIPDKASMALYGIEFSVTYKDEDMMRFRWRHGVKTGRLEGFIVNRFFQRIIEGA